MIAEQPGSARNDFNGLVREGESLDQALGRLERRRDYTKLIGTDDGQRLLDAINRGGGHEVPVPKLARVGAKPSADDMAVADDLSAERTEPGAAPPATGAQLVDLPLDLVDVGLNVRAKVEELEELAASIREHGVLQPIKATGPHPDGRYLVTWGQRRTLASRLAERATIPAFVLPPSADVDHAGAARSIEQLVENLHRADLNPVDRAQAMRAVVDGGVSQAELARKLGIAPSTVANDLRILTLDPEVLERIRVGEISASHGKAMASLPSKHQAEIASRIVSSKLSAHQIESELQWRRQAAEGDAKALELTENQLPKLLAALEAAGGTDALKVNLQPPYNMNRERLSAGVAAAGYRLVTTYVSERPPQGKCDCRAVRVEFNRSWKVTPGCADNRHLDRQRNADLVEDTAVRQAMAAKAEELRRRIRPLLDGISLPVLVLAHGDVWTAPALIAAASEPGYDVDALRDELAKSLASRVDPSRVYNDRLKAVQLALDTILAMTGEAAS